MVGNGDLGIALGRTHGQQVVAVVETANHSHVAAIGTEDRKSTRLNSSHTVIFTLSLHDALPILPGLPTTVTVCATMVAQIHGCNCAPANTGPPMGWLVMVILALPWVVRTVNKLSPLLRPLTTPM